MASHWTDPAAASPTPCPSTTRPTSSRERERTPETPGTWTAPSPRTTCSPPTPPRSTAPDRRTDPSPPPTTSCPPTIPISALVGDRTKSSDRAGRPRNSRQLDFRVAHPSRVVGTDSSEGNRSVGSGGDRAGQERAPGLRARRDRDRARPTYARSGGGVDRLADRCLQVRDAAGGQPHGQRLLDRKSTRLNSSHVAI